MKTSNLLEWTRTSWAWDEETTQERERERVVTISTHTWSMTFNHWGNEWICWLNWLVCYNTDTFPVRSCLLTKYKITRWGSNVVSYVSRNDKDSYSNLFHLFVCICIKEKVCVWERRWNDNFRWAWVGEPKKYTNKTTLSVILDEWIESWCIYSFLSFSFLSFFSFVPCISRYREVFSLIQVALCFNDSLMLVDLRWEK